MTKTNITEEYSFLIGLQKSIKNTFIVIGVPALIYLLSNANEWMPQEYEFVSKIMLGLGAYLVKNFKENK